MTSEGWIKKIVKEMLDACPRTYYHMPVQNGMGAPSLDFICCIHGSYVAIETKAPGKKMTDRQEDTARSIQGGGGVVYSNVGSNKESLILLWNGLQFMAGRHILWVPIWDKWYANASK